MAYFKDTQLKKLTLKSNPDYWVEITTNMKYGDLKGFASVSQGGDIDFATSADLFLKTIIKAWNLDDGEGNIVPITPENIDKLEQADALMILSEADGLVDTEAQKKTSPSK